MKYKQIPSSISIKNSSQIFLHLGLQIIIVGIILYFIPNQPIPPFIAITFIIVFFFLFRYLRRYASDWIKDKKVLGQIELSNTEIKSYKDMQALKEELRIK